MNTRHLVLFLIIYLSTLFVAASISYLVGNKNINLTHSFFSNARGTVMVNIPRARMDLAKVSGSSNSVRMDISLEVADKDVERLEGYLPRIMDRIQTHMLTVRPQEIKDGKGLQWLRDDLAWEANLVSGPVRIKSINFRDLIVD